MTAKLALQFIEIDLDRCANTYGTAPCTASIPATGDVKCFNSKRTCQDVPNFINDPVTLRFAASVDYLPFEIECVPSILSINFDPATLSLGDDLGQRATLTAIFNDAPDSDTGPGGDNYLADRTYNPFEQGSYWGKFRARHPYVRARAMRWITGFVPASFSTSYANGVPLPDDILDDQATRHFVIESFTGPTPKAEFTIVGKDILKLADGDRALAPAPSHGFLSADINSAVLALTLSPAGIGDLEYPTGTPDDYYVSIGGKEIVKVTSRAGNVLTIVRAQLGTAAAAHTAQDLVQLVLRYESADPANIIADLFETYAGVSSAYIPIAAWQLETTTFLNRLYTATIAIPISVNTLVSEIIQQAALAVWWRDDEQTIGLQVLRGIDTTAAEYSETNYLADSLAVTEQPDKRVSQVLVYFAQINPLTSLTDAANYGSRGGAIDEEAEDNYGSAAIKQIFSRWIPAGGRAIADRLGDLILARFVDPPRRFNLSALRDSNPVDPAMARGFRLLGRTIQDEQGAATYAPIEVTRVNPGPDVVTVQAEEMLFVAPASEARNVTFDFNVNNVNLRTAHDLLYTTAAAGDHVVCTVLTDVIIGSTSTALPAFDVGSWPTANTTGKRTSGSPILTNIADTSTYTAGMGVIGSAGIPAGAKILTVDSPTQITLDKNATSGAATVTTLTITLVIITLDVRGRLQGRGGNAGRGGDAYIVFGVPGGFISDGFVGDVGGPALKTRVAISLLATVAEIWGGGGGGGGGGGVTNGGSWGGGGGAGGGQGSDPGIYSGGGSGTDGTGSIGSSGTSEAQGLGGVGVSTSPGMFSGAGGQGGGAGLSGSSGNSSVSPTDPAGETAGGLGGAPGSAIDGVSYMAVTGTGDIRGPQIN
jgi:hypothetical protein